jgi:hypothetical protein
MEYQYSYNQPTKSSGKVLGISLIFFIFGALLTLLICYLIYDNYLKNEQVVPQIIEPKNEIKPIVKLLESDINIDDSVDGNCIQKRKFFDSDFDRTIYPINDNEIIYF